jgi:hypothetical protein
VGEFWYGRFPRNVGEFRKNPVQRKPYFNVRNHLKFCPIFYLTLFSWIKFYIGDFHKPLLSDCDFVEDRRFVSRTLSNARK